MNTLQQAIDKMKDGGSARSSLRKHLKAAGINDWCDITRNSLYEFRDLLCEAVAPSTAKTITAYLKSLLNRYSDVVELPSDWGKILSARGDTSRGTFLTLDELKAFEAVKTISDKEKLIKYESLIEAFTGARISDIMTFTKENFVDGYLVYTSQKTNITASVPISQKTMRWIAYAQKHRDMEPSIAYRNIAIRNMARRAGINERVKIRRGGVEKIIEKWQGLSSHAFRRSCATNLVMAGASLTDAKLCLGHTSEAMTSRYVVATKPRLSQEAMAYFNI